MIDLSFLTEEEQETILSVLQRDSELKKSEEQRVQKLHQSLSNRDQLKYLTGDWFYETKQLRHQDRIHGSDIILASMRHTTQKPLTILELSQILPEESSFVGSDNKEVFVPPLLCGLLQENNTDRYQNQDPYDTFKDIQSTTKQRKNPFNSELCAHQALEEDHTPEQTEDALPSFDCSISYVSNLRQDASLASQDASKNGAVSTGSNDSFADTDGPEGRQTNSSAPRGILKPLLSSSFTDTSVTDLDVQNPIIVDPSNDTWTDRRQVRFNSMVTQGSVERQKGKELGEHSLLDFDSSAPSEMRNGLNNYDLEGLGETSAGTQRPVLNQSQEDAQDDDVSCKNEAKLWGQEAGRHRVLGDVSERWHSKCRSRAGSSLVSAEQDPGYDDSPTSIMAALKRLSTRMTVSRSLEDLTSQPSEERTKYGSGKQMNQSLDDVSSLSPSASYSKQLNASVSVPVLQLDETDSDSTFDTSLSRRRNTGSSTSNISLSSGMASMSSQVSGSISSIFHADYGNVEVQGNIQFAMNYIQKLGEFHIFVVHCRDLAVADTKKHRSDPYVKCYLLPDKSKLGKRKTTVKKKTLNPNYSEILRFKIFKELLRTHNLNVSVWHNDVFGRNIFLGEVDLDLSEWDFSNTQINEYTLKARVSAQTPAVSPSRQVDGRGQMRVALRFLPQTSHSSRTSRMETGEVQIWVKDCKSLPSVRGVIIDPFVKCTVLPDTNRKSRQKTRVVKRTANPMFNHTMVYDGFRAEDLREACVEITVWDHDRLNSHFIGGLRLGLGTGQSYGVDVPWMDSTTAEAHLWQRMLQSDGEWVEDVLPLRIFLMAMAMSK
ncbi:synaptotagmin-like protein 2 isoform X4 [Solea solea]|uniref:synaptotagmin-like protein 2 isoform X4 n=1 Tax=Solea solea TaxID=90069 RepID=UPI00272BA601|nr:synaptotagmin-like protein 2 isoform X4 [Solea solea]